MVEVKERPKERTGPRAQTARAGEANDTAPVFRKIGVIGAGQMGNGIAHVSALAGLTVRLLDVTEERVKQGVESIKRNLSRQAERGKISGDDMNAALRRIKIGIDYKIPIVFFGENPALECGDKMHPARSWRGGSPAPPAATPAPPGWRPAVCAGS